MQINLLLPSLIRIFDFGEVGKMQIKVVGSEDDAPNCKAVYRANKKVI